MPEPQSHHPQPVRCAVYTRKSTEEGLEQEFNSLDAQREAAEAYIRSQKHLGWIPVTERYDDGGFSGGNLERPALQRLLDDIEAGRVDCVLVYKVDRLSRSLLDFARIMDRFEQRSVSFVSVTQQFNTTASLGRLTLNILLSFAQFEREIISERTRDKMSAARRKGKWVGGTPLLGYDVDPRGGRLVVNDKEAQRVREIFELYRRHRSLATVVAELTTRGWTTKVWRSKRGVRHTGRPFTKASLRLLLKNSTYAGKVTYRGVTYTGEQPALVDVARWEEIQAEFQERQRPHSKTSNSEQKALLAGLLFCQSCQRPMVATYSRKGRRPYRYYVCHQAREKGWRCCPTKSVSAKLIEESLLGQLRVRLDSADIRSKLHLKDRDWQAFEHDPAGLVAVLVERVGYEGASGTVSVRLRALNGYSQEQQTWTFEYRLPVRRRSMLPPFPSEPVPEAVGRPARLARLLALGHQLESIIASGEVPDYGALARQVQVSPARIGQITLLAKLAPQIQEYLLFLSAEHSGLITEPQLREIARELSWARQQEVFCELVGRHGQPKEGVN